MLPLSMSEFLRGVQYEESHPPVDQSLQNSSPLLVDDSSPKRAAKCSFDSFQYEESRPSADKQQFKEERSSEQPKIFDAVRSKEMKISTSQEARVGSSPNKGDISSDTFEDVKQDANEAVRRKIAFRRKDLMTKQSTTES